jgi:dTMP kinase
MFITFEGIDFSGKSTQAQLAADRFRSAGRQVLYIREPGGTVLSERIRALLLDSRDLAVHPVSELLLFSAARAELTAAVIIPALHEGKVVVCDRFYDSTTAYQGYGRGLPLDDVRALHRFCTQGTTPDLTLFVDVDASEIRARKEKAGHDPDRMESAGEDFFRRVAEGYREIAREEPGRVVVVDGSGPIGRTHETIWKIIGDNMHRAGRSS